MNYSSELLTVARRYVTNNMYAEDVLQESFIKAFDKINHFDEKKGSLGAWLRKIVINTALKNLSKKCFTQEIYPEVQYDISLHPSIYEKLDAEDLMKVINKLPDGYRQVFNLYVVEGYSHKEIGEMLNIREVSSRSNLSRAKEILRIKIQEHKNFKSWAKIV